jgi:hypothetical protein
MHRESSLDTIDHERVELYHVRIFLLLLEGTQTLEDRQTCIYHRCQDTEKYYLLTEIDISTWLQEVLDIGEYAFIFTDYLSLFDVEDDDILIIGHER